MWLTQYLHQCILITYEIRWINIIKLRRLSHSSGACLLPCRYGSNFFCKWRDNSQILLSSRCLLKCLQEIVIINQCGERKFLNSKQAQQEIVSVHLLRGAGSAVTFLRCVFSFERRRSSSFSLESEVSGNFTVKGPKSRKLPVNCR